MRRLAILILALFCYGCALGKVLFPPPGTVYDGDELRCKPGYVPNDPQDESKGCHRPEAESSAPQK